MKNILSKKLFTTLATATLLLGAGVVNANTISIVNANGADLTPTDIEIGTDDVSNLFSMDINVVLDAGITAGLSRTLITWDPTVLMLNGFTSTLGQLANASTPLPTDSGSYSLQFLDLDFSLFPTAPNNNQTGAFTWATLNFSYVGPGNATITAAPVLAAGSGDGWLVTGTSTDIAFDSNAVATVSAVPVPPAMILFTTALAALGFSGRRKLSA